MSTLKTPAEASVSSVKVKIELRCATVGGGYLSLGSFTAKDAHEVTYNRRKYPGRLSTNRVTRYILL